MCIIRKMMFVVEDDNQTNIEIAYDCNLTKVRNGDHERTDDHADERQF